MPWTQKQVRYLESKSSPLSAVQKESMNAELHSNPAMGHMRKGTSDMKRGPRRFANAIRKRKKAA